jgi:hypothetical protein
MTASVAELLGDNLVSGNAYTQTNLVSDGSVPAAHTDPNLINPWGMSIFEGRSGRDRPASRSDWRRDSHRPGFQ